MVESDLLQSDKQAVIAPLIAEASGYPAIRRLNPVFDIGAERYVLAPRLIASVARSRLSPPIGNLSDHHDSIRDALDMLFSGW